MARFDEKLPEDFVFLAYYDQINLSVAEVTPYWVFLIFCVHQVKTFKGFSFAWRLEAQGKNEQELAFAGESNGK